MFLIPMENPDKIAIPLFLERCSWLPQPCQDYTSSELDLNDYCIRHPSATYFVRAQGNSMQDVGMRDGDLLVVDRSLRPQHRDIVIAEVDGGFTVKQLQTTPRLALLPMNNAYSPIYPDPDELTIFGVVTHWVHRAGESVMYALADVNSFYCSVEKCFRPDLRDKPVVVLSNNDGCVIARCKLAKNSAFQWVYPGLSCVSSVSQARDCLLQ
jgi:DNA polymerase V